MAHKIYTRKGDKGETTLLGGIKVSKSSLRIAAYGSVDTLNAYVGQVADWQKEENHTVFLRHIQRQLFTIGATLAVDPDKKTKMALPSLPEEAITILEKKIDEMEKELPLLRHFVLPGGHPAVSVCHLARCYCRETERHCVALKEVEEDLPAHVLPYLNRLGDYLFVLSRKTAKDMDVEEICWMSEEN